MDYAMLQIPMNTDANFAAAGGRSPHRDALIEVDDLRTHFFGGAGTIRAVDGVSFSIPRGKTVCVVGESGSGKSITGRSILNQVPRGGRIVSGAIRYRPNPAAAAIDLAALDPRGRDMSPPEGAQYAVRARDAFGRESELCVSSR